VAKPHNEPRRPDLVGLPLMDLVPKISPLLASPYHMQAMVSALEASEVEPDPSQVGKRIVIAAPVQHGKSTTMRHWIIKRLLKNPRLKIVHASYADAFAKGESQATRQMAQTAGVQVQDGVDTLFRWATEEGGWVMFTSVGGPVTGYGADLVIIDDPFKNRDEAERLEMRDKVFTWYQQTILPRIAPWTTIVVVASRWHVDDLSGRLLQLGFELVHLRAIQLDGTALWPDVRPISFLRQQLKDMGEYAFAGNFQGEPYVSGDSFFGVPTHYAELPTDPGYRWVLGVDLAYSKERLADYFAMALLKVYGSRAFIVRIHRTKADINAMLEEIRTTHVTYGKCPVYSYMSGPEVGWARWLQDRGVQFEDMPARYNKVQRSQETRRAWNEGRILVPEVASAPWVEGFLGRTRGWRGLEADQSDEIDALVSACDGGLFSGGFIAKTFGKPRM